jgi:hypothetical protein
MTVTNTRIAGAITRLEVTPGDDVEVNDVIFGIVRLRVASDTNKVTADGDSRTVGLGVQDLTVVLDDGPLLSTIKLALTAAAADRDRAAGRPPLEHDGETVDGQVDADLEDSTTRALEELEELERELTGGDRPDDDVELDPDGADDPAPDDEPDPFAGVEPDLELEEDTEPEPVGDTPLVVEHQAQGPPPPIAPDRPADGERYLAIDGVTVTEADVDEARSRVVNAFGTDYVDEPSTALREDLLGIEHVAAWLLRDLRLVEQAAGARPEVIDYLDGRLATTLERYREDDPWKGYRSSTVETILGAIERRRPEEEERGNWPELAERVVAFERAHKARKGVLDVVEAMLEVLPEAELPAPDPNFEPTEDPAGDEADR